MVNDSSKFPDSSAVLHHSRHKTGCKNREGSWRRLSFSGECLYRVCGSREGPKSVSDQCGSCNIPFVAFSTLILNIHIPCV
ncbi:hypothetical protein PMIN01_12870 [Paraphaeosphaeria minitans]|uniref:Uncharacterized protein n=1 Tax=Paraphaeosphaeria minitans TaxID=565426 RepID=A0A9P6G661_9PLEO|nr:hypothetical protein PMIN01_12870 [Paraphaeosphaeria minitans]